MSDSRKISIIKNNESIDLDKIKILNYASFSTLVLSLLTKEENHCVAYFAFKKESDLQFIMLIADDLNHQIAILSHLLKASQKKELQSLSKAVLALHIFEREIHENFGVNFIGHPWLKPVRFAHNSPLQKNILDYPFYQISGEELHQVGVGPIHAGIIEPGHFRFICNGEKVLHLEIQLGWQHRGLENLLINQNNSLQQNLLAENISGDTVIGHTTTFVQVLESLSNIEVSEQLDIERALALELERLAIHTGDIGALCVDAGYHLGANVFGVLRTPLINFMQAWCGNRFGKSLIRIGGTHFPFNQALKEELLQILNKFEKKFEEMVYLTYRLPSIQNRFDNVGVVSKKQAQLIGAVGLSARMTAIERDIRVSHPNKAYQKFPYITSLVNNGDVFARFILKKKEIRKSIAWIRRVLDTYNFSDEHITKPNYKTDFQKNRLAVSLVEAWRGEICHCAITDKQGQLIYYKIKDPSLHNWKALELSLRNVDISDFPINNKSYNLSYCGHDL